MAEHLPGFHKVVGPDKVSHLHREAHSGRPHHTAHQPRGGLDQTDGSRGFRSQMAHHRRIDKKHHHVGDLCQNGRDTQSNDQIEFFATRHGSSLAYGCKQRFCFLVVQHIRCL